MKSILIPPLIAVWLQVRVLSEPTTKSIAVQSPVFGRGGLSPQVSGKVPSSSERAACNAPNAEKFDNQKPRAASLLFVRRGTQSYDEFIAAVPLLASPEHDARDDQHVRHFLDWRKRKCMYLVSRDLSANAGDNSSPRSRSSTGMQESPTTPQVFPYIYRWNRMGRKRPALRGAGAP